MYFAEVETNFLIFSILNRHDTESIEGSAEQYNLEDAIR
jgi:hypothetical protein